MRQTKFSFAQTAPTHGGILTRGRRKGLRPLSSRRPIHLVLKARRGIYAQRKLILPKVQNHAKLFSLRLYSIAVAEDHIHLVVRIPGRREYRAFIRAITGVLARKLGRNLWTLTPFTRVGFWGRDYRGQLGYLEKNRREALGDQAYEPRQAGVRTRDPRLEG